MTFKGQKWPFLKTRRNRRNWSPANNWIWRDRSLSKKQFGKIGAQFFRKDGALDSERLKHPIFLKFWVFNRKKSHFRRRIFPNESSAGRRNFLLDPTAASGALQLFRILRLQFFRKDGVPIIPTGLPKFRIFEHQHQTSLTDSRHEITFYTKLSLHSL